MHRHRQRLMREKRIHPEIDQYLLDGNPERNEQKQIHTFSNPVTRFLFCLFRLQSLTRLLERLGKPGFQRFWFHSWFLLLFLFTFLFKFLFRFGIGLIRIVDDGDRACFLTYRK